MENTYNDLLLFDSRNFLKYILLSLYKIMQILSLSSYIIQNIKGHSTLENLSSHHCTQQHSGLFLSSKGNGDLILSMLNKCILIYGREEYHHLKVICSYSLKFMDTINSYNFIKLIFFQIIKVWEKKIKDHYTNEETEFLPWKPKSIY